MLTAVLRKKNRITIPVDIIKQTGLKENDPLKIDLVEQQNGYKIIIEPLDIKVQRRRKSGLTLKSLYENFSAETSISEEVNWGDKVGQEEW